jgi:type II secretory pathway component PulK
MRASSFRSPRQAVRASALIAVYWVIAILSLAVFTSTQFLFLELETHSSNEWEFRAGQFADMGLAVGAHPLVERWDPVLRQQIDATGGFHVSIRTEGERVNLNHFLASENGRVILTELFINWGLDQQGALETVDALADWTDEDDDPSARGAESPHYLARGFRDWPRNARFRTLDEVTQVLGFDRVMEAAPAWRDAFTVLSGGGLDLNEAPAPLIKAVCRCGDREAGRLISVRLGPDGLPDTQDDVRFESLEEAVALLGLGAEMTQALSGLITVNDKSVRIVSMGTASDVTVERVAVLKSREGQPVLLDYQTRVLK